jgi:hypothetical protein
MTMDQEMILISRENINDLIKMMRRAEGYCLNARSVKPNEWQAEPTESWPGACGYSRATFGHVIESLEAHL